MKEQFIPYELALRVKKLGFDGVCFGYYRSKDNLQLFDKRSIVGSNIDIYKFSYTKAPLWQQIFDWFREKYELPNWIYESTGEWYFKIVQGDFWIQHQGIIFKSYEEARQACLEKLIEIVKNKS